MQARRDSDLMSHFRELKAYTFHVLIVCLVLFDVVVYIESASVSCLIFKLEAVRGYAAYTTVYVGTVVAVLLSCVEQPQHPIFNIRLIESA